MNDEVRKALFCLERNDISWHTVNNELTRLTEVADAVEIRLHDVTAKLEAANALLDRTHEFFERNCPSHPLNWDITTHLSEPTP
jgi:hypothetical protein